MSALRGQTVVNIRERAGGRKQKPEREDGHLWPMGVGVFYLPHEQDAEPTRYILSGLSPLARSLRAS